jgi:hypothetical protein
MRFPGFPLSNVSYRWHYPGDGHNASAIPADAATPGSTPAQRGSVI